MHPFRARIIFGITLLALSACAEEVVLTRPIDEAPRIPPSSESFGSSASFDSSEAVLAEEPIIEIPAAVRIDMDFASQAPTGNWDPPYDEACEEASLIIVSHYLENSPLDIATMDRDILDMVAYEEGRGLPIDIDMHQLASVAEDMYGYQTEVIESDGITIDRIELELAQGNPVIVPLAGQDIGNPYYTGEGPPYHVLVIVGYNATQFITHDVGTRRGENYAYRKNVIMNAIHDWHGSEDTIRTGPRRLLVVTK